jgi:hypothetical protein
MNTLIAAGPCGLNRGGEFSECGTMSSRNANLLCGRVIMAGQHRAKAAGLADGCRFVLGAKAVRQGLLCCDVVQEILFRQAMLAAHIVAQLAHVAKLALARRMIHQADNADTILRPELGEFVDQRLRTHLGPQMQKVVDPKRTGVPHPDDLIREQPGIFAVTGLFLGDDRADPQRVKHRGDPGRGEFAVMRQNGARMREMHLGARLDVTLQIVGVQFDQPGQDQITLAVKRSVWHAVPLLDSGDFAMTEPDGAADNLTRQDKRGIGKNGVSHERALKLEVDRAATASPKCDMIKLSGATWTR